MPKSDHLKKNKATMKDVAGLAGVTIGTVSHVINGTAKISPETVSKVKKAIDELNYRPNLHAQALRKPIAKSIGYLAPDITTSYYSNFFSYFVRHAYEEKFSVSAINFRHNPSFEMTEVENLISRNFDAILLHNGFDDASVLEMVKKANIPLILLDRHQDFYSHIAFNNTETIKTLISLLHASGYNNIGYVSESILIQNLNDRYIGYITGMQENGLAMDIRNVLIHSHPEVDTLSIGYNLMKERIQSSQLDSLPDVFIASSDLIALGAIRAFQENGIKIPDDIAIIGCDNSPISNYIEPPLTSIQQSPEILAEHAWKMLKNMLFNKSAEVPYVEILPQTLVVRKSAPLSKDVLESARFADFIETTVEA